MKKTFSFIQVFSLIFVLFATSELLWPRHLLWLDGLLSDYLVKIHARDLPADPDIVIISIDDASLAEMEGKVGKWVWPRSVHGEILEAIHQQGPKAIVFDLTFNEKDKDRPESDQRGAGVKHAAATSAPCILSAQLFAQPQGNAPWPIPLLTLASFGAAAPTIAPIPARGR